MNIAPFRLESYFAQYEFTAPYLMCSSDCESMSFTDLMAMEPAAREEMDQLWLGYTQSRGHPKLREEIAHLYPRLQSDQVLVFNGAEEGIFLFQHALLEKGDHIIVQWPCFQSLYEVANSIGCEISLWTGIPGEKYWSFDLERLKQDLRPDTKAVFVNGPHNPTGYLMPHDEWADLVALSQQHGFWLFSDEVYTGLEQNPADALTPACQLGERCISLNVLSKSYGLAGLRIGWLAAQDRRVLARVAALKHYTTMCSSAPSEFLATLALRHRLQIVDRNRNLIMRNLVLLDQFFARHEDQFAWYPPVAGSIAFPALRGGVNAADFSRDLVQASGVLLLPGDLYADSFASHFRVGFGRANMPEALSRLEDYLDQRTKL